MSDETKTNLIKRAKSFAWRLGCVMVIAGINYAVQAISSHSLPAEVVTLIGLLASEATKYINNHTDLMGARLK